MRCPFAYALASPVGTALAVSTLVVCAVATAAPRVIASRQTNTTEPAPRPPILTLRPAPAGSAILDVVGPGDWCNGLWTAARKDRELTFGLSRDRSIAMGGTCALRLTVTDLPAGRWTLRIGDAQLPALVRRLDRRYTLTQVLPRHVTTSDQVSARFVQKSRRT